MTQHSHPSATYRFGEYEFRARDLELRLGGSIVPIARKPAQLLALLFQHRDRLVERAEIVADLWPDVRVSEAAFHSVVRDLRRAIGDDRREPRWINTARGRGFRFVGPVQVVSTDRTEGVCGQPYVGRAPLLERLRIALDSALRGGGRVVLLGGVAGVGKTRTAQEIAAEAQSRGAATHFGRCWRPGFAPPYRPWVELLASLWTDSPPDRRDALLQGLDASIARFLPDADPGPVLPAGDEIEVRLRAFEAVTALIQRSARSQPLVLVIDDLEDADPESLEMLEFVAGRLHAASVLILGNYRAGALPADHPLFRTIARLSRLPHFEGHTLTGLDAAETRDFVRAVWPESATEGSAEALRARTGGNPLLLGLLVRSDVAPPAGHGNRQEAIPALVREWMRGNLLELAPDCVRTLEAAAVIGRVFDGGTVARMLDAAPSAVERALAVARREGVIVPLKPPFERFAHTLLQEAIYDDLPADRRIELHRRAGAALAALGRDDLDASIARHLVAAISSVGEQAIDATERAAETAWRHLAFDEAVRLDEMALQALDSLPVPNERRRCEVLIHLGRSQLAARRVGDAWQTARRAAAAARSHGTPEQFARAALLLAGHVLADSHESIALFEEALERLPESSKTLRGELCSALSMQLWYQGPPARRVALALEALEIARAANDARAEVVAVLAARHARVGPEKLSERIELASEALGLAEKAQLATHRCSVLSWRAADLLERGDVLGAQIDVDTVARLARSEGATRFRAFVESWRAMRASMAGRFAEAGQHCAAAHELMQRAGDPNGEAFTGLQIGNMLLERGRTEALVKLLQSSRWVFAFRENTSSVASAIALVELESGSSGPARSHLERAAKSIDRLAIDPEALGSVSWLAEIAAALDAREHAERLLEQFAAYEHRAACFYGIVCRGAFARYLGLLARTAGRMDDAERWYAQAVATNQALEAHVYRAWSLWEWSETIAARGDGDHVRAEVLAREACQLASELGLGRLQERMRRGPRGAAIPESAS